MPGPAFYSGVWDEAAPTGRSPVRTLAVAGVILVVLAWVTFLGAAAVVRPDPPVTAAMGYVPADGTATDVFGISGGHASLENSRIRGPAVLRSLSSAMTAHLPAPADPGSTYWWRAVVLADDAATPWLRLFRLTTDGIELDAAVMLDPNGDAGTGAVFDPGIVMVPADAGPTSWNGSGTAVVPSLGDSATYRYTATMTNTEFAGATDCLEVVLDIEFTSRKGETVPWTEQTKFCAGRGVVRDSTQFAGRSLVLGTAVPAGAPGDREILVPDPVAAASLDGTAVRTLDAAAGDPAFGRAAAPLEANGLPYVSSDGVPVWLDPVTGDLRGATLTDGTTGAILRPSWFARPGASPTSLGTVGGAVLVGTADRRLTAYVAGGHRAWQVALSEVAVGPAVAIGADQVVVGAVDGTVTALALRDGSERWHTRIEGGVAVAPATSVTGDLVAVADTSGGVSILDARTGEMRAHSDGYHSAAIGIAVEAGTVVLWGSSWVDAYDVNGTRLWGVSRDEVSDAALVTDPADPTGPGAVVVAAASGTTAYQPMTGEILWQQGIGGVLTELTGGVAVSDGHQVQVLDAGGAVLQDWPVPRAILPDDPASGGGLALRSSQQSLWLFARAADDTVTGVVIGRVS